MGSELSTRCQAFTLTVQRPAAGRPRELVGQVVFSDEARAGSVDIQLALLARRQGESLGPDDPGAETAVAGCSATVERTARPVPFALQLPPVAATWVGKELRADPALVASADDGSEARLVIELPVAAKSKRLIVRGLPKQVPFAPPNRFFVGVVIAALGAAALAVGAGTNSSGMYAIGAIAVAFGTVVAGRAFGRARARFALGNAVVRLDSGGEEGRVLDISVAGVRSAVKARVGLRAVESERSAGARSELAELSSQWVELERRQDGALGASIALPDAADAPPSLSFSRASRVLAFRWLVEVELEGARGFRDRSSLPLHVGVEELSPAPVPLVVEGERP